MSTASVPGATGAGGSRAPRPFAFELAVPLVLANGALDAYTYLAHQQVFATAQTGNVVLFALGLIRPDVAEPWPHLWPIIAFCVGVWLALLLHRPDHPTRSLRPRRWVLVTQVVVLVVIAAASDVLPLWVIVSAISFTAALQLALFRTVGTMTFVPVAMTGNLMRTVEAFQSAASGGRPERLVALRFTALIAAFAAGVGLGAVTTTAMGGRAAIVPAAVILLDYFFILARRRVRDVSEGGPETRDPPATISQSP